MTVCRIGTAIVAALALVGLVACGSKSSPTPAGSTPNGHTTTSVQTTGGRGGYGY
jgi:hypothetical protein